MEDKVFNEIQINVLNESGNGFGKENILLILLLQSKYLKEFGKVGRVFKLLKVAFKKSREEGKLGRVIRLSKSQINVSNELGKVCIDNPGFCAHNNILRFTNT